MKTTLTLAAALAALALWLPTASAQDDDDDIFDPAAGTAGDGDSATAEASVSTSMLGIGFSVTTGGVGALEAEYWIGDKLAISALGRIQFISPDPGDSIFRIQVGFGGLLVLKQNGPAMLMGGGRFLLGFDSGGDADSTTSIALEAPLRLQAKVAKKISLHVEAGVAIGIGDGSALGGGANNDFTLQIGTSNVFGGVGMTVYL